jgi:hypothetical protein
MGKYTLLLFLTMATTFINAQTVPLKVKFTFINIEDGYDHLM